MFNITINTTRVLLETASLLSLVEHKIHLTMQIPHVAIKFK